MATVTYPEGAGSALSNPTTGALQSPSVKRISWSAILAGVTVAVAVQLALSLLGAGIGFGLVDPLAGDTPGAGSFGLGAGLWWLVSTTCWRSRPVATPPPGWRVTHSASMACCMASSPGV